MKIPDMARRTQATQISLQTCLLSSKRLYLHVTAISVSCVCVRDFLECHMIMALLHVPYMDYYCAYSALRLLVCIENTVSEYPSAHNDYIDAFGYKFNKYYSCL